MSAELTVHPVGLNAEEHKILSVAMNVLLAGGWGVRLAEQVKGETVVVVDVDSAEGRAFYESDRAAHRAVVIAGDDRSYRADALIRKPLRVQALRNMLSDLFDNAPANAVEAAPAAAPSAARGKVGRAIVANGSLFYAMVNAVATGSLLKVTAEGLAQPILLHGPSRHLYTHLDRRQVAQAAALKEGAITVTSLDEFAFMKEARGVVSHRLERFLWLAEQHGAMGIAPSTGVENDAFRLSEWPRFDIEAMRPEYLSLSALMTRHTLSCAAAARMVGVAPARVYDFFHAATACGVVEQVGASQEAATQPQEPPQKGGSLMARIAKKLGLNLV